MCLADMVSDTLHSVLHKIKDGPGWREILHINGRNLWLKS